MLIGIISPASIALNRFLPALAKISDEDFSLAGIAVLDASEWDVLPSDLNERIELQRKKAVDACSVFGGNVYLSASDMMMDPNVDALYIALPPAFHSKFVRMGILCGKHILCEKPFGVDIGESVELVRLAESKGVVVLENYMFLRHKRLRRIIDLLSEGALGELRLIRADFGFPFRGADDFRYAKEAGGGALFDCGGYPIRLASELVGSELSVLDSSLFFNGFGVDIHGSGTLGSARGLQVQVAFGMDNSYKCSLEIWGSKGCLTADRIFTPPANYEALLDIYINGKSTFESCGREDTFENSIRYFLSACCEDRVRSDEYKSLLQQARLVESFREEATSWA